MNVILQVGIRGLFRLWQAASVQLWDDDLVSAEAVRTMLKHLEEPGRALILAWLCTYFEDNGAMFSPQFSRQRNRSTLNGVEYWSGRVQ
ncbi:MAG TPA: hypothetical protein VKE42_06420 [Candidatus Cybelea sp.]|nr:hypothetical protein [Candidatus Cybelea sp.]